MFIDSPEVNILVFLGIEPVVFLLADKLSGSQSGLFFVCLFLNSKADKNISSSNKAVNCGAEVWGPKPQR